MKSTVNCSAAWDDTACKQPAEVLVFCRYHWRQNHNGRPFTGLPQPRRKAGSSRVRDSQGRKECGKCLIWKATSQFTPAVNTTDGLQTWCSPCASDYMSVKRYGLTRADVEALVLEQGGCAMCGTLRPRNEGFRNGWHVDHDHSCCPGSDSCGKCIRSVLCARCNKLIGLAGDDVGILRKAIAYLS